jgi:putative DNA primase/helicase
MTNELRERDANYWLNRGRREQERLETKASRAQEEPQAEAAPQPQQLPAVITEQPQSEPEWLIIDPSAPLDNAREFARRALSRNGARIVWFWGGQYWRWNGQYYAPFGEEEIRGQAYLFLDGAYVWEGAQRYVKFKPSKRHVDALLDALRSCLALPTRCVPPMWLDGEEPATDWVVFRNYIVNVVTLEKRPLTHRLWAQAGLDFDWDPEAECPVWEKFCKDLFGNDWESVEFLEEYLGYCMTGDTKFEKAAMLIGPRRSGKSTIVYLIGKLVGDGAHAGLSFNDWLSSAKALQVLIGKRVISFSDVRLKPGKFYGRTYDAGGIDHKSSELLLKITGNDKISIGQLYAEAWNGVLQAKIVLTSNEVINFNDPSSVLPTRFIKVQFRESFAGREDLGLRAKLTAELPGIAMYCLGAYHRALARGHFVQPASAGDLERAVLSASDPWTAMAYELFEPDRGGTVIKTVAYDRKDLWADENGHPELKKIKPNQFGARLREVPGFEHIDGEYRPYGPDGRQGPRVWLGMRLRKRGHEHG